MTRKLNFDALTAAVEEATAERLSRWSRREENPTVQMSLRMKADQWDKFRALCAAERRTNGEMIEVLMDSYLKHREA